MSTKTKKVTDLDVLLLQLTAANQKVDDGKWEMGDILVAIRSLDDAPSMEEIANSTGLVATTLYRYREVSEYWTPEIRVPGVSWSVHRQLTGKSWSLRSIAGEVEGRQEFLTNLVDLCGGRVTVKAVSDAIEQVTKAAQAEEEERRKSNSVSVEKPAPVRRPTEVIRKEKVGFAVGRAKDVVGRARGDLGRSAEELLAVGKKSGTALATDEELDTFADLVIETQKEALSVLEKVNPEKLMDAVVIAVTAAVDSGLGDEVAAIVMEIIEETK